MYIFSISKAGFAFKEGGGESYIITVAGWQILLNLLSLQIKRSKTVAAQAQNRGVKSTDATQRIPTPPYSNKCVCFIWFKYMAVNRIQKTDLFFLINNIHCTYSITHMNQSGDRETLSALSEKHCS